MGYYTNLSRALTREEEDRLYAISSRVRIAEEPPRVWLEDPTPEEWAALRSALSGIEK